MRSTGPGFADLANGKEQALLSVTSAEPRLWRVTLGLTAKGPSGAAGYVSAQAIITYATEGIEEEATVDVGRGTTFGIIARELGVKARATSTSGRTVRVYAAIAPATAVEGRPTYTETAAALVGGVNLDSTIPKRARRLTLYRSAGPTSSLVVAFGHAENPLLSPETFGPGEHVTSLPIPNRCDRLRLASLTDQTITRVYELEL